MILNEILAEPPHGSGFKAEEATKQSCHNVYDSIWVLKGIFVI
jgi:hypothetical protein